MRLDTHWYAHEPAGARKQRCLAQILAREQKRRGKTSLRVLDVGCGNGNLAAFISSLGHTVAAIDTAPEAVSAARRAYQNLAINFLVADVAQIAETFDVVTAFEVCEHVSVVSDFVENLRSRLVADGLLIISVPNGWSVEELARRFIQHTAFGKKFKQCLRGRALLPKCDAQSSADSPHLHFWGGRQWRKIFRSAGFTLERVWNVSLFFKQLYYLGGRRLIKPGGAVFTILDSIDSLVARVSPNFLADGWLMAWRKSENPRNPVV